MLRRVRSLLLLLSFVYIVSSDIVQAGLIISYGGPVSVQAGGGTAAIDVLVSSTDGSDVLDIFGGEFELFPTGGAVVGGLQFGLQGEGQLIDPSYIHTGNSLGTPIGNVSGANSEIYIGGDATLDGLGTTVPTGPNQALLFRLNVQTTSAVAGDVYEIGLINGANTLFWDPGFSPLTVDGLSFTNRGVLNITPAAVPEPSSMILVLAGAAAVAWKARRRRAKR